MAKEKLTRKELLKSPDEFLTLSEKVFNYLRGHKSLMQYVGIGVAGLLVVYLAGWWYLSYANKKAQAAYNEAYELVNENLKPDPDPAALKKARGLFEEVVKDYGLSDAADLALPQIAFLQSSDKQFAASIESYRKFEKAVSNEPPYPSLSALAIAANYESSNEYDQAIAALEPIMKDTQDPFRESAMYQQARLYALAGQTEKAKELFNDFVQTYPTSPFKSMAEAHL